MRDSADQLRQDNQILAQQSIYDREEISELRHKIAALSDRDSQGKKHIEDLSRRLAEER